MSIGLAFSTHRTIYLAAESQGVPYNSIISKIFLLQNEPTVYIVCTGGLEHWHDVKGSYVSQLTIKAAAEAVRSLLDRVTIYKNDAHALVCGFEKESPQCFRIDRASGCIHPPSLVPNSLDTVQVIGISSIEVNGQRQEVASTAKRLAENYMENGLEPDRAMLKAIEDLIAICQSSGCLRKPAVCQLIKSM